MSYAKITVTEQTKAVFDEITLRRGGIPQHRMVAALLAAWNTLSMEEQNRAIESASRTPDPAETTAA